MNTATHNARKPAQLEMIGGKNARQRLWEAIRNRHGNPFDLTAIARSANVDTHTAKTYLQRLIAGEYVEVVEKKSHGKSLCRHIKDTGVEAPRLNRKGEPETQGLISEAIWRTLRILSALDAAQIVGHVAAAGHDVALTYVKRYLASLKKAGYLQVVVAGNAHRLEKVQLKLCMDTGPRAPQIQRVKTVYDPNLNKVMHTDDPEELS
ncbi:hypothetical protein QKW35_14590 [Pontibacterium granulatum]|uniref:hypothetical protein n=1 Tax=Pontibacterium granulatum TaxID=2036029 RepID=UPI00249A636E|nr:hypothetical protein [Pontibacterium granulatum]MDI3325603.1 hypothetical protein [Pontibacterium granulatum]